MNVTQNVIQDLLPVYAAGEASADTVALVEEFLQGDPELARAADALRGGSLPELPGSLRPTKEKETLTMTKQLLWWRGVLMGLAIFLTLTPLSFRFDHGEITWRFLQETPLPVAALVVLGAVSCWAGFLHVRRRLQGTGL